MGTIDTCSCDFGYPESCEEHNRVSVEPLRDDDPRDAELERLRAEVGRLRAELESATTRGRELVQEAEVRADEAERIAQSAERLCDEYRKERERLRAEVTQLASSEHECRTEAIKQARHALFALQNSYPYGSADFQRVYRMRIELDQIAHCETHREYGRPCRHTAPTECSNDPPAEGADEGRE